MSAILIADCLSCGHTESLEAARIFEFDTRCPKCGELLVLQEEDGEEDEDWQDGEGDFADALADPRTRADEDDDDPYALAAHSLDPSVDSSVEPATKADGEVAELALPLSGSGVAEAPLPRWDGGDTQQVNQLAQSDPEGERLESPLPELDRDRVLVEDADVDLGDDELLIDSDLVGGEGTSSDTELDIPSVEVSETEGRASRSYDSKPIATEEGVPLDSGVVRLGDATLAAEFQLAQTALELPEDGEEAAPKGEGDPQDEHPSRLSFGIEPDDEADSGDWEDERAEDPATDPLAETRGGGLPAPASGQSAEPEPPAEPEILEEPAPVAVAAAASEPVSTKRAPAQDIHPAFTASDISEDFLADEPAYDTARLFPTEVDWLALLDENLSEEEAGEDDEGSQRRILHLSDTAATKLRGPTAFEEIQEAIETGGTAGLERLLLGGGPSDSRVAQRFESPDEATRSFPPGTAEGEDPAPTEPFSREEAGSPPAKRGEATRSWPSGSSSEGSATGPIESPGAARRPSSGRLNVLHPPRSSDRFKRRRTVEQFQRGDLDTGLVCARDVSSREADHFRRLYQRVFRSTPNAPRMVLVTSAHAGEGKTTVASNLAIVGARIPGQGSLLIDADTRGRGVMRAFGQRSTSEGLLEALAGGHDPERYIVRFNMKELDVVPLGLRGSESIELIASEAMQTFLDKTRALYPRETILIDSSPLLESADPQALVRLVDAVVLVVRAGATARADVERAVDLIGRDRLAGIVLNDALVGAA